MSLTGSEVVLEGGNNSPRQNMEFAMAIKQMKDLVDQSHLKYQEGETEVLSLRKQNLILKQLN
jgi:hypothetical protein